MAQRKPMLDFISEGDWRLADERQRLLAPLAESENGSVEDVDRVARLLKLSRASVYRLLRLFRQHLVATSRAMVSLWVSRQFTRAEKSAAFDDIPRRIFLDSSALQVLQSYGGFLYENEALDAADRIHRDPAGVDKLMALRCIMKVAERAPFQFALSHNSFLEVTRRADARYVQWAHDVLDHWLACLEEAPSPAVDLKIAAMTDTSSYNYLGTGDRALIKDALLLGCDSFLTMENKLPKNADHIRSTLRIRILSPLDTWELLQPWAALFL
jgi:hypothetical protein